MHHQFEGKDIKAGMTVVGSDVDPATQHPIEVGRVKEVRGDAFLMDVTLGRDLCVPFSEIRDITDGVIALKVEADEVGKMGWDQPAPAGESAGSSAFDAR